METINNNHNSSRKINVSIKQQENGSIQAAETMKQMAELARQSADAARQILQVGIDIVGYSRELSKAIEEK